MSSRKLNFCWDIVLEVFIIIQQKYSLHLTEDIPTLGLLLIQIQCQQRFRDTGVAKSWTWLSDFTFTSHFHALEKAMATHSSVLAWRIPGMGEPGGLLSLGLHRVGHDWSNLAAEAAAAASHWQLLLHSVIPFMISYPLGATWWISDFFLAHCF